MVGPRPELGSVVVAYGLSCSVGLGILLGQGLNLCPLHWQADSYLLYHQGSPWMLSFKPAFSLSSFTFIKRLFSSFSLSTISVVSSAYLGLLIFLPAILIPACASSSLAFHMIYSACKLNKQGNNIQPWRTLFPIWNQFTAPCLVLTVGSWSAYRFLRRQVRWSGIPISLRIFHSLLWSTQSKDLAVNKAEIDVFLELSYFFDDPTDVGNLISGPMPFLNPAWTSGSSWFTYYWSLAWRILSITLLACEKSTIAW